MRLQDYIYLKQCSLHDNPDPIWKQFVHEYQYKSNYYFQRDVHC
jgi:hypothetical protein